MGQYLGLALLGILSQLPAADLGHSSPPAAPGSILRVGPNRPFTTIAAAIAAASDGDLVLVDLGIYDDITIAGKAITVASAGGPTQPIVLVPRSGTTAVHVHSLTAGQVVTLQNLLIGFTDTTVNAIRIESSPAATVRLLDVRVTLTGDLLNVNYLAPIEIHDVGMLFCDSFAIAPAVPGRVGNRSNPLPPRNHGLPAMAASRSHLVLRHVNLRGFDNPTQGLFTYGGDGVMLLQGASLALQRDFGTNQVTGGNGANYGGSAVHVVAPTMVPVSVCGTTNLIRGNGTVPGGILGFNNDGGRIGPGLERMIPACLVESVGHVLVPVRIAHQGSTLPFVIGSFFDRNYVLFLAPNGRRFPFPGVEGIGILDYAAATTLQVAQGFLLGGSIQLNAHVPVDPALTGLQLTTQAVLGPPQGQTVPALSFSHGSSFVIQ